MPFPNGNGDFDACKRAHSDKRDPAAYCAAIMRAVEGEAAEVPDDVSVDRMLRAIERNESDFAADVAQMAIVDRVDASEDVDAEASPGFDVPEGESRAVIAGLSSEAVDAIRDRYNVDVEIVEAPTVADGGTVAIDQQAVGDDEWSAQLRTFRVLADPDDETEYNDDVLGVGVDFPEAGTYVDWHRAAFPDALDEPHVSEYGSIADLEKATGNIIETPRSTSGQMVVDQQMAQVDAITLAYPPGGEVIDHEEGDWTAFLDDLAEVGDVFQVWGGGDVRLHPIDDLESHDAPTHVALDADADVTDVEEVLADHPAVDYTINAGSVDGFDRPDDWDPDESDFAHGEVADGQETAAAVGTGAHEEGGEM